MKKILSLIIAMLMIVSMVPLAFAQEEGERSGEPTTVTISDDEDPEIMVDGSTKPKEMIIAPKPVLISAETDDNEAIMFIKENRERFMGAVDECFKRVTEKFPKANSERVKKYCAEVSEIRREVREEIKPVLIDARAQLKERMGEIREGAAIKLENLREEQKERLGQLNDEELKKIALLDRARVKKFSALEQERLKAQLAKLKINTVRKDDMFKKRMISEENIERAREKYKGAEEAYDQAKESFEKEKGLFEKYKNKDEEKAIEHGKKFLNHAAELVTKLLEKIKYKVEENDDLTEDEASEMITDIDERIAAIADAQEEVNAATTKEEVKQAGKVIIDEWNKVKARVREHVGRLINAKVGEIIQRSEHLEKKLNDILIEMEEKGIEVDAIDTKVDLFSMRVEEARNKYKTAQTLFDQIKEMKGERMTRDRLNTIKTLSEQAKTLSKEAHSALKEAHTILMTIVRDVKQAGGGEVNLETEEEYVEVVEEEVEEEDEEETETEEEDTEDDEEDEEDDNEEETEDNITLTV